MAQLIEFLANHFVLTFAFLALSGGLVWTFLGGTGGAPRLNPFEVVRLVNDEDAVVVDVRVDGDYHNGHILDAVHLPTDRIEQQADKLKKHKDKPVVIASRAGQGAALAVKALKEQGFEKVYILGGGILAWEGANLPLTKK